LLGGLAHRPPEGVVLADDVDLLHVLVLGQVVYQRLHFHVDYRIKGSKMWISGAEHSLTDNIVHLVLAKIPNENGELPPGPKGISLFVVPKFLVEEDGRLTTTRNDVVLTGLNHKLGYRGIPNTLLGFGENGGAIGYRIGEPGQGLALMFHMMNEARINIGMGAAMLGYAGYKASLNYARE